MRSVEVINLEETIRALRRVDSGMASKLKSEIRQAAKPTLAKARQYAGSIGVSNSGAYAGSLFLKTNANGVAWASSDPAAGVKEFANPGAIILTGPRKGKRAGVPLGSAPPRALLKAVLEDQDRLIRDLNDALSAYVDEEFDRA